MNFWFRKLQIPLGSRDVVGAIKGLFFVARYELVGLFCFQLDSNRAFWRWRLRLEWLWIWRSWNIEQNKTSPPKCFFTTEIICFSRVLSLVMRLEQTNQFSCLHSWSFQYNWFLTTFVGISSLAMSLGSTLSSPGKDCLNSTQSSVGVRELGSAPPYFRDQPGNQSVSIEQQPRLHSVL